MFPVFNFRRSRIVDDLPDRFFENGILPWDVCPRCSHCLQPYSVTFGIEGRAAEGGYIVTGGKPVNLIDEPYRSRSVRLVPIPDSFWTDSEELELYADHNFRDGVNHQFGGRQLRRNRKAHSGCLRCKAATQYLGTIENDDLNVGLTENGEPFSLVIGDVKSLNVYLCRSCYTLTYCMTEGMVAD